MTTIKPERAPVLAPFETRIPDDIATAALPDDERMWVPIGERASVRPLLFDTAAGSWVSLLRVQGAGVVGRHLHPGPVHGFVLKGRWHYLERDWIAEPGDFEVLIGSSSQDIRLKGNFILEKGKMM